MLDFWLPVWSYSVDNTSVGKLDPRNVDLAFGILLLANLGAEILLLPVWRRPFRPPCCDFWLPVRSHSVENNSIEKLDTKNVGLAVGIIFVCSIQAKLHRLEWWILYNFYYFRFCGRHIGILDGTRLDLIAFSCSPAILRKSHQSTSLYSKRLKNGAQKTGLGGNFTPRVTLRRLRLGTWA